MDEVEIWITLEITFAALFTALVGGVLISIRFAESQFMELVFYPYAVVLQVTPIVAVGGVWPMVTLTCSAAVLLVSVLSMATIEITRMAVLVLVLRLVTEPSMPMPLLRESVPAVIKPVPLKVPLVEN